MNPSHSGDTRCTYDNYREHLQPVQERGHEGCSDKVTGQGSRPLALTSRQHTSYSRHTVTGLMVLSWVLSFCNQRTYVWFPASMSGSLQFHLQRISCPLPVSGGIHAYVHSHIHTRTHTDTHTCIRTYTHRDRHAHRLATVKGLVLSVQLVVLLWGSFRNIRRKDLLCLPSFPFVSCAMTELPCSTTPSPQLNDISETMGKNKPSLLYETFLQCPVISATAWLIQRHFGDVDTSHV